MKANLSGQPAFQDIATGPLSIPIRIIGRSRQELVDHLRKAKEQGCIGVITEIVFNQYSGRVIEPREYENLHSACCELGLLFAVDETITAIRCGAPFAWQRSEYQTTKNKPDLVFFGKAVGCNGMAINFDGTFMQRMNIRSAKHKRQAIDIWQNCVTQAIQLPILIDSLGVLEMAKVGDWVARSKTIGGHLRAIALKRARSILGEDDETKVLGGLECFMFVQIDLHGTFKIMGASNAGPWVRWTRWLPRMDKHLTNKAVLESILESDHDATRLQMSRRLEAEGMKPEWCFWCGNHAINRTIPWCRSCCTDICDTEECAQQFHRHKCGR